MAVDPPCSQNAQQYSPHSSALLMEPLTLLHECRKAAAFRADHRVHLKGTSEIQRLVIARELIGE